MANDTFVIATHPNPERVATIPEVPLTEQTATTLAIQPRFVAHDGPCPLCCHWVLPVSGVRPDQLRTLDGKKATQFMIALEYQEWLLWHLHVVGHQGLDRRMQVNVA